MNRHRMTGLFLLAAGLCAAYEAKAQKTYEEMELLTVNEQVTTVITASEPVHWWTSPPTRWRVTSHWTTLSA